MDNSPICSLCATSPATIKKSHIIPKFLYDYIQDGTDKMPMFNLENLARITSFRNGIYEEGLLCQNCENKILGSLDTYGAEFIKGRINSKIVFSKSNNSINATGIDYIRLKLFFLSILWRASISKHDFFNEIDLQEHEMSVREMLLNHNPGSEECYRIVAVGIKANDNTLVRLILKPAIALLESERFAVFFISGFVYLISLEKESSLELFASGYLSEQGNMTIRIISGDLGKKLFSAFGITPEVISYYMG